ncbi:hypothetical protein CAPTEDRAFT_18807 [Capitella teleta]|uniref:Multifunctional methyltransferase subunit TRM112-like protein n=1 Tax=Capitella teleta TaxID=283909 RepID=R7V3N9_CAPTE|nr:hypothetical protein CAPTEDRAFT_18807 [Capitella teleta]|eukprot:ELU10956.1 hypothetical protein CAPTEDRAFT_18807 [Capitella teleta]
MKLLTHNMLTSNIIKGVKNGYPLKISASDVQLIDVDFNPEFITRMIPKINWKVLHEAAQSLGHANDLPAELNAEYEADQEFLKKTHHVLLEVEVQEGDLICPETERKFPISHGIPNMLLKEEEI